ncbi:PRTRC system protein C [Granulicella aggregans]|nr:PRTRC system protein C [Granulicella aggregans]
MPDRRSRPAPRRSAASRCPDPAPAMSVDEVREFLTPTYPEIATATLTGPDATGTSLRYTFGRAIGSKG